MKNSFSSLKRFIEKYHSIITLHQQNTALILSPNLQGRVLFGTPNINRDLAIGWINPDLFQKGIFTPHISPYGGADRFWLAPEAGQFALFFKKDEPFDYQHWQTPKPLDETPFQLVKTSKNKAHFKANFTLENYAGFFFNIEVNRWVTLFNQSTIEKELNIKIPSKISALGYASKNKITNAGKVSWSKKNGLISIWILGMFEANSTATAIIPYQKELNLNTNYFNTLPPERIKILPNHVLFRVDGALKSKIGLLPQSALNVLGSYDAQNNCLTIIKYSLTKSKNYPNSLWQHQKNPFGGDVINVYNDGPNEDGTILGPYFELETTSATKTLAPQKSIHHTHATFHFVGSFEELNRISKNILHFDLNNLKQ